MTCPGHACIKSPHVVRAPTSCIRRRLERRRIPMNSKDVAKWSAADWKKKVKFMRPSGGGAVGVAFCWTEEVMNPGFDHKNLGYGNPKTCQFVLKPIKGAATGTKFAEKVLGKIGGTAS